VILDSKLVGCPVGIVILDARSEVRSSPGNVMRSANVLVPVLLCCSFGIVGAAGRCRLARTVVGILYDR
jgi:hypothetical protein